MSDGEKMTAEKTSVEYDEVPYPSGPIRQTHPCLLATLPAVFGVTPVMPSEARVLELGCASAGNLMPMAQDLPSGRFLGIDLSARQIEDGLTQLNRLPIRNLEIRHLDIADFGIEHGEFDYIICHGVYSWAPNSTQKKILEIGRNHLSPNGVLYVSYNTLPGWHLRSIVRDMMRYHVSIFQSPQEKIGQARSLLEFLENAADTNAEAYRIALADEARILSNHSDAYLYHEHLEEVNEPIYFSEFAQRAQSAGLQYLGESEFPMMLHGNFDQATAAILAKAPMIRQEQYMDFLRARTFRCSLLCHQELQLNRAVSSARLQNFAYSLSDRIDLDEVDLDSHETIERQVLGGTIALSSPVTKRALFQMMDRFPGWINLPELEELVFFNSRDASLQERTLLQTDILTLFSKGVIRAAIEPPSFVNQPGQLPMATPLARDQAAYGFPVTNRLHTIPNLDSVSRWTLARLDGTISRADLAGLFQDAVTNGEFEVADNGIPLSELEFDASQKIIDHAMAQLARNAFLIQ